MCNKIDFPPVDAVSFHLNGDFHLCFVLAKMKGEVEEDYSQPSYS